MRPLACFRAGKQALTDKNVPRRFIVSTLSNSAPLITSSLAVGKIPAFPHRMQRRPYRSTAAAAIAFVSASSLTSALKALALPFASVISLATLSLSVLLRATTRTEQPTDPKRRAIPRPIPLLAPVTTAVRPASELNIESSVLLVGGPPQANLEASTERPCSNMRNQPNPGDAQGTCYTPPRSTGVLGSSFSTDRLAVPTWGGRAACGPRVLLLAQGSVRRTSSFGTAFWQARLAARTTAAT